MSFRLQYASNLFVDLHKQKFEALVKPVCSTLALVGNIGKPNDAKTYHFLNYCSRNWDTVLWVSGTHEVTDSPYVVRDLSREFQNVRCLDSEETVFPSENAIVFGLPPDSPHEKFCKPSLTHSMLRTVFWTMTNPMFSIIFLRSKGVEKNLLPLEGNRLEAPVSLWITGTSKKNRLSIDSNGKQLFATNSYFQSESSLLNSVSYSPTAFVEIVTPGVSLRTVKHSLQLA